MRVLWTRPALAQLEEIGDHVASDDPAAAVRLVRHIRDRTDALLSEHPRIGRPGRDPATRELVVAGTPYIVGYRVRTAQVEILAVMHGARLWPDRL